MGPRVLIHFRAVCAALALALLAACGPTSLPDGGRVCPDGTVDTGAGCALRRPNGQSCTSATACASGYCTDGVCCESSCGGPCLRCDGSGSCIAEAELSLEDVCGAYACGDGRCLTNCTKDNHCAPDAHCENRQCVAARGNGAFCSADNQCKSHNCVDGFCCDSACGGACDACNLPGSEGTCSTVALGTSGAPTCGSFVCDGQNPNCPSGCVNDTLCASGRYCDGQGTCAARRATGTACADARECLSGFCADGFCCDTACGGACDKCNEQGDEGTCRFSAAGEPGTPVCTPFVCTGSLGICPPVCANDFQCISGRFCAAGGCQPQKPNGQACTEGRECLSGQCADGVCCNAACGGQCDACNLVGAVGTCTLQPLSAPGTPSCAPYLCNGVTANCGLACTTVGPGAPCSSNEWCDGVACAKKSAAGALCTQGYQCGSGNCVDGVCCDSVCSGACDSCNQRGFEGACQPELAGTVVLACSPYTCDGNSGACPAACSTDGNCISSMWCDGLLCAPKKPQGQQCGRDGACLSGHCADGYCCSSNCGNACDACNVLGLEGTCTPLTAGSTPSPSCGLYVCGGLSVGCPAQCQDDDGCTQDAWCNQGVCEQKRPPGGSCSRARQCTLGFCSDGFCCDSNCSGACDSCALVPGTCNRVPAGAAGAPSCAPFVCNGVLASCPTECDSGADCAAGNFCTGPRGVCTQKLPDGDACVVNAQCISGNCADGFCCNAPCQGGCESCATNPGTCTAFVAGDPGAPSCGAYVCDGASGNCPTSCPGTPTVQTACASTHYCVSGQCTLKLTPGVSCFNGLECGTGNCIDGVCCDTACTGACDACNVVPGTCSPRPASAAGSPTCFPFACDGTGTSCPTSCAGNGDCASNICSGSVCQKRPLGDGCAASFECASNCCDQTSQQCSAGPTNCF